jgi:hypothetical protein
MPGTVVRRRLARRSGSLGYRLRRWMFRSRVKIALAMVFVIVVTLSAVAFMMLTSGASAGDAP